MSTTTIRLASSVQGALRRLAARDSAAAEQVEREMQGYIANAPGTHCAACERANWVIIRQEGRFSGQLWGCNAAVNTDELLSFNNVECARFTTAEDGDEGGSDDWTSIPTSSGPGQAERQQRTPERQRA